MKYRDIDIDVIQADSVASGGAIQEDIKEEDEEEDDDDKNDDVFGPEKQALTNVFYSPTGLIKQLKLQEN